MHDPTQLSPEDFDAAIVRGMQATAQGPFLDASSRELAVLIGVDPDTFDRETAGEIPVSAHTIYRYALATRMDPMIILGDWHRTAGDLEDIGTSIALLQQRLGELRKDTEDR